MFELINRFNEWYYNLWYNAIGEEGMNITQGIMGVFFIVMCFIGAYLVVDKIESYF